MLLLFFCGTKKEDILKNVGKNSWWNSLEVKGDQKLFGYQHFSKYLLLFLAEDRN